LATAQAAGYFAKKQSALLAVPTHPCFNFPMIQYLFINNRERYYVNVMDKTQAYYPHKIKIFLEKLLPQKIVPL